MRRLVDGFLLCLAIYPLGLLFWLITRGLRLTGHLRVIGQSHLRRALSPVILLSNHPSLLEPLILPVLFTHRCWCNPWRIPWSTPDGRNYGRWWCWLRPRAIFVQRGENGNGRGVIRQVKAVLEAGGDVIIFGEGGRTSSDQVHLLSAGGHALRPLKEGPALLARLTGARVVPVWVHGAENILPNKPGRLYHCWPQFWGQQVVIKIGRPLMFSPLEPLELITRRLEQALLNLADQNGD